MSFQVAGSAPLVSGERVHNPETDEEILDAYRILASEEDVLCEPVSAATVAGLQLLKFYV